MLSAMKESEAKLSRCSKEGRQYGRLDNLTVNSGRHSHGCIRRLFAGFFSGLSSSHGYMAGWGDSSRAVDMSLKQNIWGAMKRSKVNSSRCPREGKTIWA
jgi:hypothetical protein